ncbi:MAG: zinc ribbon-containing protein [Sulfurimicrobium sp.]|jgi:isocitrate dehydrogenase|nr:zinc ribbon-containing protein [Sulfurimicrobium sp.]MDO9188565.1 zinc ribbon-containing protein [Sulfurimicrobium sp.]MDP1703764.1 zinc ribbon-containing protein [Sulfurimicrobium sp.]MDP1898700.1 zinc ribbon-containing protein [Sulfurimicrobium sp.]MDP2197974.1 zinc ribbon-containing protein [Sulfurimicrobium sp.]
MDTTESEHKPDSGSTAREGEQGQHEALYDRFAERVRELFDAGQEKSKEAMEHAMEVARQQLSDAGDFSAEQGEVFKKFMRRDLEQTTQDMRVLGQEAKEYLHPARLGAGALSSIARLLEATGLALQSLSHKAEDALHYHTGEITTAGTLSCTQCGQKVQLKHTAKIPPCPNCHGSDFRKGY